MKKYTVEELQKMKTRELVKVAGEFNVVGRWDMTKSKLIEAIEKAQSEDEKIPVADVVEEVEASDEVRDNVTEEVVNGKNDSKKVVVHPENCQNWEYKQPENIYDLKTHHPADWVLSQLEIGSLVAFRAVLHGIYKMRTAKVVEMPDADNWDIELKDERIICETLLGTRFEIKKKDIMWISKNHYWPPFIFRELKSNGYDVTTGKLKVGKYK